MNGEENLPEEGKVFQAERNTKKLSVWLKWSQELMPTAGASRGFRKHFVFLPQTRGLTKPAGQDFCGRLHL